MPASFFTLHRHDAREIDALLSPYSSAAQPLLTTTITSPPYGPLKDYGDAKQVGHGQTYLKYLSDMRSVFAALHTHTRRSGSLWLIADTLREKAGHPAPLVPLPFDLAAKAGEVGWTLRDVVIWRKDRTLPWSNGTRLRNAFEYVLLLVKSGATIYHPERLRQVEGLKDWWIRFPERYSPDGRTPSNVWDIPIPLQGSWGSSDISHECPLPADLVERLVLLTSERGDVVLDCFGGSGVVLGVAEALGRRGLGCELVERNIREYEVYVRPELARRRTNSDNSTNGQASEFKETIRRLRITKYPRLVMERLARRRLEVAWPLMALMLKQRTNVNAGLGAACLFLVVEAPREVRETIAGAAREICGMPPASKFGLDVSVDVIPPSSVERLVRGRRVYLYVNGRTHRALEAVPHRQILAQAEARKNDRIPPILSDVLVQLPRALLPATRAASLR